MSSEYDMGTTTPHNMARPTSTFVEGDVDPTGTVSTVEQMEQMEQTKPEAVRKLQEEMRLLKQKIEQDRKRRREAEEQSAQDRKRQREAEEQSAQDRKRQREAEEQSEPTTLKQYLKLCHQHLGPALQVEMNPCLCTPEGITGQRGKVCPQELKPWTDFNDSQHRLFEEIASAIPSDTHAFGPPIFITRLAAKYDQPIGSERSLDHYVGTCVQYPVSEVFNYICGDASSQDKLKLEGTVKVTFKDHAEGLDEIIHQKGKDQLEPENRDNPSVLENGENQPEPDYSKPKGKGKAKEKTYPNPIHADQIYPITPPTPEFIPSWISSFKRSPYLLQSNNSRTSSSVQQRDPRDPDSPGMSCNSPSSTSFDPELSQPSQSQQDNPSEQQSRRMLYQYYCTQACLLGLTTGSALDSSCPNVELHKRPESGNYHAIDKEEFRLRLHHQLYYESFDEHCGRMSRRGAHSFLFKFVLTSHGYVLVGKGTVQRYIPHMKREEMIYHKLQTLQGRHIPVCLGSCTLSYPYIFFCDHFRHFLFLSWGGELVTSVQKFSREEIGMMLQSASNLLLEHGVRHGDLEPRNLLWNDDLNRTIVIDFDRSELIEPTVSDLVETAGLELIESLGQNSSSLYSQSLSRTY